jgi:hypothetical protein
MEKVFWGWLDMRLVHRWRPTEPSLVLTIFGFLKKNNLEEISIILKIIFNDFFVSFLNLKNFITIITIIVSPRFRLVNAFVNGLAMLILVNVNVLVDYFAVLVVFRVVLVVCLVVWLVMMTVVHNDGFCDCLLFTTQIFLAGFFIRSTDLSVVLCEMGWLDDWFLV